MAPLLPSKSFMFAIYSNESLTLDGDIATEELIVHLSRPATTLELGRFAISYDKITLKGDGAFHVLRRGTLVRAFHGPGEP